MDIAGCYIVKNEEKNLAKSIKSILNAINELVVVDTGSIDNTVEIARRYGAKIFHFDWVGDFSRARNFALDKVNSPWIIFLDADEYFCQPSMVRSAILEKIKSDIVIDGIMVTRYNVDALKPEKNLPTDISLRIMRNSKELRYRGRIHENLCNSCGHLHIVYGDERLALWHTGYSESVSEEKIRRNMKMIAEDIEINGKQPVHNMYLAIHYFSLKDYDKALVFAVTALDSELDIIGGRGQLYHIAIESMRQKKVEYSDMLLLLQAAIQELPALPEFYAEKGMVLSAMGCLDEAKKLLEKALELYRCNNAKYQYDSYFTPQVAEIVRTRLKNIEKLQLDR